MSPDFSVAYVPGPYPRLELTARTMELRIRVNSLDYAVIVCPKCRRTTDTDLQFWRKEGFSSASQPPSEAW
jgi:hypothetical protein